MRNILDYLKERGYSSPPGIALIKHADNKPLLKRIFAEYGLHIKTMSEKDIQFCRGVVISELYAQAVTGNDGKADGDLIRWLDALDKEIVDKTININYKEAKTEK
jgi:hypothetical protein